MKFNLLSLIVVSLLLSACGANNQTPKNTTNENPTDVSEVQKIAYDENEPDIFIVPTSSLENNLSVSVPSNQTSTVTLRIKANKTAGQVKSIRSSSDLVIPKSCVKTYVENEECLMEIPLSAQISGLKSIRIATNLGNRFFLLNISRVNSQVSSIIISGSNNFGSITEKETVIKSFIVKNIGSGNSETLNLSMTGGDSSSYSIVYNSCSGKVLGKNKSCNVRVAFVGKNKVLGNYNSQLSVVEGSRTIQSPITSEIVISKIVNTPPQVNLVSNPLIAVVNTPLEFQVQATDAESDSLSYSIISPSLNSTISSSGLITITASGTQLGSKSVVVKVSDNKSPAVEITIPVQVYQDMIYTGNTTFSEGEIKAPLFGIEINTGRKINQIRTNLNNSITPVKISGSGVNGISYPLMSGEMLPLISNNVGVVNYLIQGGVKFAGNYQLFFELTLDNGHVVTYKKNIEVTSNNLPYMKYDLWAVRSGSTTGYDGDSIIESMQEMKREYQGWRTPILTKLTHESIVCNGSEIVNFDAANNNHLNCLRDRSSTTSETGFVFNEVYSGTRQIGGIANGTRKSFVIEKYPWSHTLAHEIGHQFGLWHTFESYWNDTLIHCTGSGTQYDTCYTYNLYENRTGKNLNIYGDFANFLVDFDASSGIAPFNYNVSDDTSIDYFNGQVYTLKNLLQSFYPNGGGYVNNDLVVLNKGGQSYLSSASDYACNQIRGFNGSTANGHPYNNPVYCPSVPGRPVNYLIPEDTVKNTMSYWYHELNSARFSTNQKIRMDRVLNLYPEITTP